MGDNADIIQVVILALIAGFIALRLRSVLGQRPDDQPTPTPVPESQTQRQGIPRSDADVAAAGGPLAYLGKREEKAVKGLSSSDQADLRRIFKPIGGNDLGRFLDGARQAYELTLKGFWDGNMGDMAPFLAKDVAKHFRTAIEERKARGERVENKLVEITDVVLDDVHLLGSKAEITVRFSSDIIAVLKDRTGRLIEGDLTDTIHVTDIWTFARDLKDKDPNWTLVATQGG